MGIFVGRADNNKSNTRAIGTFHRTSGFTLLELLFAVLVAAIVIGIGSPSFSEFRRNAQMTRDANAFLTSVQQGRSEAAKRQRPISLCAAADLSVPQPVCSGDPLTAVPASGWLLFEDVNGDCTRTADDTEPVLVRGEPSQRLAAAATSARTCISFAANGFLRSDGGPRVVYEVLFCDPDHPQPAGYRGFKLSPSGHARVTRDPGEIAGSGLACPSA
jgi:prepilin-type N-terminal cleavage/methylation domain-containing protein